MTDKLKQELLDKAHQLGFTLVGITSPDPPAHFNIFEDWLAQGRHGTMDYLSRPSAHARRANPRSLLSECKSIIVLGTPYPPPSTYKGEHNLPEQSNQTNDLVRGRIASYAWGLDYHDVLIKRMAILIGFIESRLGEPVAHRSYTDTAPILERELAQRAGIGWIGKNTCLINPRHGSYFLLSEIFLSISVEFDAAITTDQCGTCTRCLDACPTQCILPDRTLDARRCISYLTIELKDEIPVELRPLIGDWVFGCDVCQMVCPWNRFAAPQGDSSFASQEINPLPVLDRELSLDHEAFIQRYRNSPVKRPKRRGYLRNVAIALGNRGDPFNLPALEKAENDSEILVSSHAVWAKNQILHRMKARSDEKNIDRNQ